jgi:hypothetical protein
MLTIHEPTPFDLYLLCNFLRPIDKVEVMVFAKEGQTLLSRVAESVKDSTMVWAVRDDGVCIAVFGYRKLESLGMVWCVGTPQIETYPVQLLKWGRWFLNGIASLFEKGVYNYVHRDNAVARRWLERCGCVINDSKSYRFGVDGQPFLYFTKEYGGV